MISLLEHETFSVCDSIYGGATWICSLDEAMRLCIFVEPYYPCIRE